MSNELVKYQSPLTRFQPQTLDDIVTIANLFESSGMFPTDTGKTQTAAMLAVKILAGQELGLTPFAAANGMQIIKGKCTPSANIMAMKVKASGRYDYRVLEMNDSKVSVEFYEHGKSVGISNFSAADATKANTQNMGKYPRNMLFARAISNGVKWYAPDLFNGVAVYTPDEMGAAVDYETGEIIESPPQPAHRQIEQQLEPAAHRAQPAKDAFDKDLDRAMEVVEKFRQQSAADGLDAKDDIILDKTLPEPLLAFVGELRSQESPGAAKASKDSHQYAVGIIDGITGKDTHRQVLGTVLLRAVSNTADLRLGAGVVKFIFKYLAEERTKKDASGQFMQDENGKNVKERNPDFDEAKVQHIHAIHAWGLAQAGQMTIDQGDDLVLDPKTGELVKADSGDVIFA